jgi:plasmid stability protein
MASILIKNLPASLHRRLKEAAEHHRRSMAKEVQVLLEDGLQRPLTPSTWPAPVRGQVPITQAWLTSALSPRAPLPPRRPVTKLARVLKELRADRDAR